MSLLGRLASVTAIVGATLVAKKIADKVIENNPEGVQSSKESGKAVFSDYTTEVKKAAKEVYCETSEQIKQKAPEAIDSITQTVGDLKKTVTDAFYTAKNACSKPPDIIEIKPDSIDDAEEK